MRLTREQIEDMREAVVSEYYDDLHIGKLCDLALLGLAQEQNAIPDKDHNCPDQANMGEFACKSWANCWEPCGRLGHSEEHVKVAQEQNNATPSIHVGTATTDLSQPRTWNAENVQVYVPAAPDAAPQDRTSGEQPSQLAGPAAAAPVDRPTPRTDAVVIGYGALRGQTVDADFARQLERELAEAKAKIARMRPSEEAVKCAEQVITAERNAFPPIKGAKWGVGFLALTILRINEEAK